jgi:hypothetical protein
MTTRVVIAFTRLYYVNVFILRIVLQYIFKYSTPVMVTSYWCCRLSAIVWLGLFFGRGLGLYKKCEVSD